MTATVKIAAGYSSTSVITAAQAAAAAYVNGINLDPAGAATVCSVGKAYAAIFAVPGVQNVDALQLNSGTVDLTAAWAHMFAAGTISFTAV